MRSKITTIIAVFLGCFLTAPAQEMFTGFIEFKTMNFGNNITAGPEQFTLFYTPHKAVMRRQGGAEGKGRVLVNTITDSMYIINDEKKEFLPTSLFEQEHDGPAMVKTDSFRNYYGYSCRGYRVLENKKIVGYLWVNEQLRWAGEHKKYEHPVFSMLGNGHLMMCLEMYQNGKREGAFIPVNMQQTPSLPDSIFSIAGYNLEKPGWSINDAISDTVIMTMPPDTAAPVNDRVGNIKQAAAAARKAMEDAKNGLPPPPPPPRKPATRKPMRKTGKQ